MLFREIVTIYCENHMEHKNTLCGQDAESFNVKVVQVKVKLSLFLIN
jgi:hypothetical protein